MGRRESRRDGEDSAERAAARAAGRGPEGCGRDRVGGAAARSELVRLATPRVVQEALEQEQTDFVGRERYARQPGRGKRNGCIPGHLDTAEGRRPVARPSTTSCAATRTSSSDWRWRCGPAADRPGRLTPRRARRSTFTEDWGLDRWNS